MTALLDWTSIGSGSSTKVSGVRLATCRTLRQLALCSAWTLASVFGVLLHTFMLSKADQIIPRRPYPNYWLDLDLSFLTLSVLAVCVSAPQCLVLMRFAGVSAWRAIGWVTMTVAGTVSGLALALLILAPMYLPGREMKDVGVEPELLLFLFGGQAAGGLVLGSMLLLILKDRLRTAWLWPLANGAGCWLMLIWSPSLAVDLRGGPWADAIGPTLKGLSYGAVTGIVLACQLQTGALRHLAREDR